MNRIRRIDQATGFRTTGPQQRLKRTAMPPLSQLPEVREAAFAFVGYRRELTPEGGILMTYRDANLDTLRPVFAWCFATGLVHWYLENYTPFDSWLANVGCFLLGAYVNWKLFGGPIPITRSVEIRHDCMIVDGRDVFKLSEIGDNWPSFKADERSTRRHILCGIYGTRNVEYLSSYRMDDHDRTPEVLASHLHDAMMKLWDDRRDEEERPSTRR